MMTADECVRLIQGTAQFLKRYAGVEKAPYKQQVDQIEK